MTIPSIVTLEQLRDHLRLPASGSPPLDEADLQLRLDAATELVCHYIADRHPADEDWIAEIESWGTGSPVSDVPKVIVLAVLEQAAEFYRFRGDDPKPDRPEERGYLSPGVENLLSRYKNRAFA